jgi:IS5 family transposase
MWLIATRCSICCTAKKKRVWGDQAYRGQKDAIRAGAPGAKDFTNQRFRWGKRIDESVKATNRRKSSVRTKVEQVFGMIKRLFGFQKVCYRGLAKNLHQLDVTAALANVFLSRRRLLNA